MAGKQLVTNTMNTMQNALTPGPWQWEIRGSDILLLNPQEPVPIIKAKGFVKERDARALQAVPELVAALRDCITEEETLDSCDWETARRLLFEVNDIARAALAKAGQA
jgi:hypothetical protein